MTNATGGEAARQRYFPYGQGRPGDTPLPTDYRFTGQRNEGTIGLYDYGARFYDPLLGRFVSADTVVPEPGNPQALNRFSYVLNNPLRYIDPSGHQGKEPDDESTDPPPPMGTWEYIVYLLSLTPGGREALAYIHQHDIQIKVCDNMEGGGVALYPNNIIIIGWAPFTSKDLAAQIDTAGTIVHEVEHFKWAERGAIYNSKEQEGAAFAAGDAVKAQLFRYFGDEKTAATYDFPTMSTKERIEALSQPGSIYNQSPDYQIWSPNNDIRDVCSAFSRLWNDAHYHLFWGSHVRAVYP